MKTVSLWILDCHLGWKKKMKINRWFLYCRYGTYAFWVHVAPTSSQKCHQNINVASLFFSHANARVIFLQRQRQEITQRVNLQNDQSLLMMTDWWLEHQALFLILGENTPYFHITPQSFSRHWIEQQIWRATIPCCTQHSVLKHSQKTDTKGGETVLGLSSGAAMWMCRVAFKVGKTVGLGNLSKAKRAQGGNKLRVCSLFPSLQFLLVGLFFKIYSPVKNTKHANMIWYMRAQ